MSIDSEVVKKLLEVVRDNALDNGTEDYKKGFFDALNVVEKIVLDNAEEFETDSEILAREVLLQNIV